MADWQQATPLGAAILGAAGVYVFNMVRGISAGRQQDFAAKQMQSLIEAYKAELANERERHKAELKEAHEARSRAQERIYELVRELAEKEKIYAQTTAQIAGLEARINHLENLLQEEREEAASYHDFTTRMIEFLIYTRDLPEDKKPPMEFYTGPTPKGIQRLRDGETEQTRRKLRQNMAEYEKQQREQHATINGSSAASQKV